MARPEKFWDRIAERYARQPIADEAAYRRKLEITRGCLRPDMQLLEFGCGTGSTAIAHAPHVSHIRAIDASAKMIDIARSRSAASRVANVTFEQATIEGTAFPDGAFDAVLGLSILHLLEDRASVMGRVYRMLKPGGIFVTSTTCLGDTMKYFRFIAPIGKFLGLMPLVRVFTASELAHDLTEAGFMIEHRWQPGKNKAVFIVARKAA